MGIQILLKNIPTQLCDGLVGLNQLAGLDRPNTPYVCEGDQRRVVPLHVLEFRKGARGEYARDLLSHRFAETGGELPIMVHT